MKFGISTACFYPTLTEASLQLVANLGADITEIFFNAPCEIELDFLKELKKIATDNNIEIRAIHPFTSSYESFLIFSDYKRRLDSGLEFYKKIFCSCTVFGCEVSYPTWREKYGKNIT